MIDNEDRQPLAQNIEEAQEAGISVRTLQHWKAVRGVVAGEGRLDAVHSAPADALTPAKRDGIFAWPTSRATR